MRFFVKTERGDVLGPLKGPDVAALAAAGKITPYCLIQRETGSGTWHLASSIKGLAFGASQDAPRPSPPAREQEPEDPLVMLPDAVLGIPQQDMPIPAHEMPAILPSSDLSDLPTTQVARPSAPPPPPPPHRVWRGRSGRDGSAAFSWR